MTCEILTFNDFTLEGNKLRIEMPGVCAVLIMTGSNDMSLQVRQILDSINIRGMGKAYIDVHIKNNRKIIDLSAGTTTPIKRLPFLVLSVDGKIRCKYTKKATKRDIETWLRLKFQEFSMEAQPQMSSRSRQSRVPAMSEPRQRIMNPQEPQITERRQKQSFSIAESQDSENSAQRSIGAPVGLNAAWRCEK